MSGQAISRAGTGTAGMGLAPVPRPGLRSLASAVVAGCIASIVLLANIVSFAALMFPGDMRAGFPIAIWALLIGSCIGGAWIASSTSIQPLASGIDSPTGAVLVVLSEMAGAAVMGRGGSAADAVQTTMLLFSAATVVSGATFYALGAARLGAYLRFIPYFVVGGFLTATGWLLVSGGLKMATGHGLNWAGMAKPWSGPEVIRAVAALCLLGALLFGRRLLKSSMTLPVTLLAAWALMTAALKLEGVNGSATGWYFPDMGNLQAWVPVKAVMAAHVDAGLLLGLAPEVGAVAIIALLSLITKVASVEVSRNITADLDRELRAHGLGNLIAAPFGGLAAQMQIGTSKLLEQAGGPGRISGLAAALALGLVGLSNFDVQSYVPTMLTAGLVFYLGYSFLSEALARPIAQRAWQDLTLAILIAAICTQYGFVVGILAGLILACLMFAFNYARIGVVRRHATRAQFASHVLRSEEASRHLARVGEAIQIYWLRGYIFFGSAERLFEQIRQQIAGPSTTKPAFVVLDFSEVPGADSSAVLTLIKLRNTCQQRGIAVICCAMAGHSAKALEQRGLFGKGPHKIFPDLNAGLAHCEADLLARAKIETNEGDAQFHAWLQAQIGPDVESATLGRYLERRQITGAQLLYRQGDPAVTMDLIAAGNLIVHVDNGRGGRLDVRRFSTHTVIGEMGFFRKAVRSASISAEGNTIVYTLTRENFAQMRAEQPALAMAFDDFIVRTLADRLDFANRTVEALTR